MKQSSAARSLIWFSSCYRRIREQAPKNLRYTHTVEEYFAATAVRLLCAKQQFLEEDGMCIMFVGPIKQIVIFAVSIASVRKL